MANEHPHSGPFGFFKRHLNGHYSLGRSWFNTLIVALLVLLSAECLALLPESTQARYASIAVLLLTALNAGAWCWSIVGTWRSASMHVSRGGTSLWAGIAKVAIGLLAFRLSYDLITHAPVLAEYFRVARGRELGLEPNVQICAGGRSLLVSGVINDDTADKLQQALNHASRVQTIVFSSKGGWVGQGLKVARVISSRRLDTYVEKECSSACTIAFLSGLERTANPKARIGFHPFRLVGAQDASLALPLLQKIYREAGLSEAFIARVSETPPNEVWYPTTRELLVGGVLTKSGEYHNDCQPTYHNGP